MRCVHAQLSHCVKCSITLPTCSVEHNALAAPHHHFAMQEKNSMLLVLVWTNHSRHDAASVFPLNSDGTVTHWKAGTGIKMDYLEKKLAGLLSYCTIQIFCVVGCCSEDLVVSHCEENGNSQITAEWNERWLLPTFYIWWVRGHGLWAKKNLHGSDFRWLSDRT